MAGGGRRLRRSYHPLVDAGGIQEESEENVPMVGGEVEGCYLRVGRETASRAEKLTSCWVEGGKGGQEITGVRRVFKR